MKRLSTLVLLGFLLLGMSANILAADDGEQPRNCAVEHFIGTGETMNLSFSVCKEVLATPTFLKSFNMDCQHGLVTYQLKERPSAKYLRLSSDGSPVHCSST